MEFLQRMTLTRKLYPSLRWRSLYVLYLTERATLITIKVLLIKELNLFGSRLLATITDSKDSATRYTFRVLGRRSRKQVLKEFLVHQLQSQ